MLGRIVEDTKAIIRREKWAGKWEKALTPKIKVKSSGSVVTILSRAILAKALQLFVI